VCTGRGGRQGRGGRGDFGGRGGRGGGGMSMIGTGLFLLCLSMLLLNVSNI
jgi:hypothetical protein